MLGVANIATPKCLFEMDREPETICFSKQRGKRKKPLRYCVILVGNHVIMSRGFPRREISSISISSSSYDHDDVCSLPWKGNHLLASVVLVPRHGFETSVTVNIIGRFIEYIINYVVYMREVLFRIIWLFLIFQIYFVIMFFTKISCRELYFLAIKVDKFV